MLHKAQKTVLRKASNADHDERRKIIDVVLGEKY
jgi:hypothetical protein